MAYQVRLTKDSEIIITGTTLLLPMTGEPFFMTAGKPSLYDRLVWTAPIVSINKTDSIYKFKTKHNEYCLEIFGGTEG